MHGRRTGTKIARAAAAMGRCARLRAQCYGDCGPPGSRSGSEPGSPMAVNDRCRRLALLPNCTLRSSLGRQAAGTAQRCPVQGPAIAGADPPDARLVARQAVLGELGYLPVSVNGGALRFHLVRNIYGKTSLITTTNLSFSEWSKPPVRSVAGMAAIRLQRSKPECANLARGGFAPPTPGSLMHGRHRAGRSRDGRGQLGRWRSRSGCAGRGHSRDARHPKTSMADNRGLQTSR
jgi:hypothetical protein